MPDEKKPYDAGDPAAVKEARRDAKQVELDKIAFLQTAMETVNGRKWFYDLLVTTHCFSNPYSATDRGTAFNCGEMNIGLPILADLNNHCPEQYLKMMQECRNG